MSSSPVSATHDDPRHPDALALEIVAAALRAVSTSYGLHRPRASHIAAAAVGALAAASVVAEDSDLCAMIFDLRMAASHAQGTAMVEEDHREWRAGYDAAADVQGRVAA